jgi:predicted nucleotidyltransferase
MVSAERQREAAIVLLQRGLDAHPEVLFAVLHGSFLTTDLYRDIDVAVWIDPGPVPTDQRGRWAIDLASELEAALGARVDVQVLNGAPLGFRYHALNGRPLVVRDAEFFATLRERTWDEYFDFAPAAREYLREVMRRDRRRSGALTAPDASAGRVS